MAYIARFASPSPRRSALATLAKKRIIAPPNRTLEYASVYSRVSPVPAPIAINIGSASNNNGNVSASEIIIINTMV